jgi:hypothetical protein
LTVKEEEDKIRKEGDGEYTEKMKRSREIMK